MDFDSLYLRVLKFLAFRPRSEKEVREYLKKIFKKRHSERSEEYILREAQDDNLIDSIIQKLQQQKFLNDLDFARWLVRSRTEFKPKGKYVIQQELRQKGINQDIIDKVLGLERGKPEEDLATEVLLSKKRQYEHIEPNKRFHKAGSMLARRGFSFDVIKTAIDRVFGKVV